MKDVEDALSTGPKLYSGSATPVRIWLLGGFRVSVGTREVREDDWRRQKSASLVKLLALATGHRLHRERVAELLWPGYGPKQSLNNLNRELHEARQVLQSHDTNELYLCLENKWLDLCPNGTVWVDVEAFEAAAANARRMGTPAAYEIALNLYAGELLPQDSYEEWAEIPRMELRETHLRLLTELAVVHEKLGRPYAAIETLERAVCEDPTHEAAQEALMRLYTGVGRRHKALEKYGSLRESLEELGYEVPHSIRGLYQDIRAGKSLVITGPATAEPSGAVVSSHNLPQSQTSFVGREWELAEIKAALSMTGLLTLTGGGGSGKTRLALETAREVVGAYPDGVWFVELAPLSDPGLIPQATSDVLGLDERSGRPAIETLLDYLRDKELLLVLDNCEHLTGASAELCGLLLDNCPNLKVLATSREPLGLPSEMQHSIPPLALPDLHAETALEELAAYGSVQLLVDRTTLRSPDFSLEPENAGAVASICRKLEGIPLALELAASRVSTLGAQEVASHLEDSLGLLSTGRSTAPGRQETLRAALDWSHELLEELDKKLFRRLAVFAGGWTLEAARVVAQAEEEEDYDVPGALHELVEKSLVVVEPSTPRRYRFLEPVRQYALEWLEASPDYARTRRRHVRWFLDFASRSYEEVLSPNRSAWLQLLEAEQGNFRAALAWTFSGGDGETGLRLMIALRYFWAMRGHLQEGRRWLERGLQTGGSELSRAWALDTLATIAMFQSDYDLAYDLSEKALDIFREADEKEGVASCVVNLGFCAALGMKNTEALPGYLRESEELKRLIRDRRMVGYLILFQGLAYGYGGDFARAKERFTESRELHESLGEVQGVGLAATLTGLVALAAGEDAEAAAIFSHTLPRAREFGDRILTFYCLWGLASATSPEHPARAAVLWGAARSLEKTHRVGLPDAAVEMAAYGCRRRRVVEKLGEKTFEAEWSRGEAMSDDEAIAYALTEPAKTPAGTKPRGPEKEIQGIGLATLTRREREVAELIAAGLTNRRASERLHISPRTVDTHVARILKKLGAGSREEVSDLLEG